MWNFTGLIILLRAGFFTLTCCVKQISQQKKKRKKKKIKPKKNYKEGRQFSITKAKPNHCSFTEKVKERKNQIIEPILTARSGRGGPAHSSRLVLISDHPQKDATGKPITVGHASARLAQPSSTTTLTETSTVPWPLVPSRPLSR